uniref:Uncharacterized protein n=1 Tax=Clytia hemisphaerica TaxID=252671 RepID=A0A7M5UJP8_9CNID
MIDSRNVIFILGSCMVMVLFSVSCGGIGWSSSSLEGVEASIGLWKYCASFEITICKDIPAVPLNWKIIRAFIILAVVSSFVATLTSCLALINSRSFKYAGVWMLLAVCFGLFAVVTFTIDFENEKRSTPANVGSTRYDWAYGLCWAAVGLGILVTAFAVRVGYQEKYAGPPGAQRFGVTIQLK